MFPIEASRWQNWQNAHGPYRDVSLIQFAVKRISHKLSVLHIATWFLLLRPRERDLKEPEQVFLSLSLSINVSETAVRARDYGWVSSF